MLRLLPLLLLVLLAACAESPAPEPDPPVPTVSLARPDSAAIAARVAEAEARLGQTEAGRLVWAAIEAHGGLARWYANGPIRFRFRYENAGDTTDALETEQVIDTWRSRARHTLAADTSVAFGWTGEDAWIRPADAEIGTNARFWSLTPYYFVAMPFVLADPGVQHALDGTMAMEGRTYDLVRVTFAPGTGDAPDDYYVLLLDPATHRVGGVRYVVSYPGFFPDGGHSPEKVMCYDGAQTIAGITLQEGFRSFAWTDGAAGEPAARGTLTGVGFEPALPDSAFAMPPGAAVQPAM